MMSGLHNLSLRYCRQLHQLLGFKGLSSEQLEVEGAGLISLQPVGQLQVVGMFEEDACEVSGYGAGVLLQLAFVLLTA